MINTNLSGGVRVALEYSAGLAKRGHDVYILVPEGVSDHFVNNLKSVNVVSIKSLFKNVKILNYAIILFELSRKIRWIRSITHRKYYIIAASWQAVLPSLFSWSNAKNIIHLLQHDDEIINTGRNFLHRKINSLLYSWTYKRATNKIAVSTWLQKLFSDKYCVKSTVVSNGIDRLKFFHEANFKPWLQQTSSFDVMCIAREVEWKGFREMCDAIRILQNKKIEVRLVIVTHENLTLPTDIPCLIKHPRNDAELGECYRSSSVFVCSSWFEGFGLPPLEAMCNGVPVISTKCGGVEDFAMDEVNCLLVEPRSSLAIANALIRLLNDRQLQFQLANAGLETSKEFSLEKSLDRFESVLFSMHANKY
jgi:glycosyltransferase involved in cell wall biosynthesis